MVARYETVGQRWQDPVPVSSLYSEYIFDKAPSPPPIRLYSPLFSLHYITVDKPLSLRVVSPERCSVVRSGSYISSFRNCWFLSIPANLAMLPVM